MVPPVAPHTATKSKERLQVGVLFETSERALYLTLTLGASKMPVTLTAYATLQDLQDLGIAPQFFTGKLAPTSDAVTKSLNNAFSYINSIIGVSDKITLPLTPPYDPNLVQANCNIAVWNLLAARGYNPENPADAHIRVRYEDTMNWLKMISQNRAQLQQTTLVPQKAGVQPDVVCSRPRHLRNWSGNIGGWGN
jgi:phage gp36-like protein